MGRKRADLVKGEYDQIVDNKSGMRKAFSPEAVLDVAGWLVLHWLRHAERADAARGGTTEANRDWAAGVIADAQSHCDVISELVGCVHQGWSVRDWHEAQEMLNGLVKARDAAGRPLHAIGALLDPCEGSPNGSSQGSS